MSWRSQGGVTAKLKHQFSVVQAKFPQSGAVPPTLFSVPDKNRQPRNSRAAGLISLMRR